MGDSSVLTVKGGQVKNSVTLDEVMMSDDDHQHQHQHQHQHHQQHHPKGMMAIHLLTYCFTMPVLLEDHPWHVKNSSLGHHMPIPTLHKQ